jgi:hypothetical protein
MWRITRCFTIGLNALFVLGLITCCCGTARAQDSINFSREILPILSNKCFVCHGPDSKEAEMLRLDTFAGATQDRGGYRAIDVESPAASHILKRIESIDDPMPPADAEKQLTEKERKLLSAWVRSGGVYSKHWSFVPPIKREVTAKESAIDTFVEEGLAEKKLSFAPAADRNKLARRASLTLTGLPPEPADLAAFLADTRPDAYELFVDQLLATQRFGEHQARYWLDAVRYGDTHGLHLDNRRGIFPYRDWVVRAINTNMPVDEFIIWQLAGDLLPNPTMEQRIATGYVRMNPSTAEGGVIPAEFQAKNSFDRTETLGTVFLGLSLTCARCHTHKYDPIPHTDYYRLLAFFNSTTEKPLDGNSYTYEPILPVPADQAKWSDWQDLLTQVDGLVASGEKLLGTSVKLDDAAQEKWTEAGPQERLEGMAAADGPFHEVPIGNEAKALLEKVVAAQKDFTTTLVAEEMATPRVTQVLDRGEYDMPIGEPLEAGILSAIGGFPENAPRNRLGLAQWLTGRDHPLVARVLVNQIWQRTFGYGLVRTAEDFGLQGEQPTHPELLDWLAVEMHDSDWDLKHMLRLMVTSRTFRQSSAWRTDLSDPENRLWGRGPLYRLDAEVLRDIGLWASGLLDPTMGGEGVKPYQPSGMWLAMAHPGSNTKQYVQDNGSKLYRKSLYVYWKRTSPHPMMSLFDAPSREASCIVRSRTNTPSQSLGLLNETQRIEMARMLAQRLLQNEPEPTGRLNLLFTLVASRKPTAKETEVCLGLVESMKTRFQNDQESAAQLLSLGESKRDESLDAVAHAAWTQLAATVLASDLSILLY